MRRHRLTPGDSLETAGRLNGVYVAKHHEVPADRLAQLLARGHAGNLITVHESGLQATFVPFHLEQRRSGQVLVTHLVRNNPQAVEPIVGDALVILDVDDAYISPSWYATNESLPNVPTWDYITIHIGGPVRVLTSPDESLAAARALTLRMEQPAVLEAVGEQKLHKMARAIVGVEVLVRRVEAKAKAGQHRHPDDLRSVLPHLEESGQTELASHVREVSLPYAERRHGTIETLRATHRLAAHPIEQPGD